MVQITIDAPWHGDPAPEGPPGPLWELWEHEVVEIFIAGPGERYLEVEMSPHGHHLVLQLDGVRNVVARELPMRFSTHRRGERWTGNAELDASLLPGGPHRMNAHAIHGRRGSRQHASLHPTAGPAPDFHQLDAMRPLEWSRISAQNPSD